MELNSFSSLEGHLEGKECKKYLEQTESVTSIKYICISLLFFGYNMAVAKVMIEFLVVPSLLLLSSTSL